MSSARKIVMGGAPAAATSGKIRGGGTRSDRRHGPAGSEKRGGQNSRGRSSKDKKFGGKPSSKEELDSEMDAYLKGALGKSEQAEAGEQAAEAASKPPAASGKPAKAVAKGPKAPVDKGELDTSLDEYFAQKGKRDADAPAAAAAAAPEQTE